MEIVQSPLTICSEACQKKGMVKQDRIYLQKPTAYFLTALRWKVRRTIERKKYKHFRKNEANKITEPNEKKDFCLYKLRHPSFSASQIIDEIISLLSSKVGAYHAV